MCELIIGGVVLFGLGLGLTFAGVPPVYAWGSSVLVVGLLLFWMTRQDPRRLHLRAHGKPYLAWLLPGWAHDMGKFYLVMVIFTFDKSIQPLPDFLSQVMERMLALGGPHDSAEEKEIARLIRDVGSFELYSARKQLPVSLTEGREVYCTKTYAQKELLPGGQLTLPYIFVLALPDMPDVLAEMAPYPAPLEK